MFKRVNPNAPRRRPIIKSIISFYLDFRYGGKLLDKEKASPFLEKGSYHTQSIEYDELDRIFENVCIKPSDVILDLGCGRGRPFNYFLSKKFKGKLIGVELDQSIADFTAKRLKRYDNIMVFAGDALDYIEPQVTLYFLFNPFNEAIFREFICKIEEICNTTRVVYFNSQHVDFILSRNGWKVEDHTFFSATRQSDVSCHYMTYNKE